MKNIIISIFGALMILMVISFSLSLTQNLSPSSEYDCENPPSLEGQPEDSIYEIKFDYRSLQMQCLTELRSLHKIDRENLELILEYACSSSPDPNCSINAYETYYDAVEYHRSLCNCDQYS